jgi:radical SAM superfamily enzyme YgiQ (UPF0313 family)
MKIGILELLAGRAITRWDYFEELFVSKQYANITAQAVSVWCRQMGHDVFYATYYGIGDPKSKLPSDLDVVFISTFTYTAPLAYALSKAFKRDGTLTVIGGPHAKAFPMDSQRFFDIVVIECNRDLISAIIKKEFKLPRIVSSPGPYRDVPSVAERLPEIKRSAFAEGRWPYPGTFIPMLASMGCPHTCDFCVDWNNPYYALSSSQLEEDLVYLSKNLPGVKLMFQDPNFAIRFDETLSLFENIAPEKRNPYAVESSLNILRSDRLARLRDTNCIAMTPGIESWSQYSRKAGVGSAINQEKLVQLVDHFFELREYIPYLGANFIFGLDHDAGDEPFELTKEFIQRLPFVWTSLNTPVPFGGTPLYATHLQGGRLLQKMPFTFYTLPFLTIILKNYDPIAYYQHMVELYDFVSSDEMFQRRRGASRHWTLQVAHAVRVFTARQRLNGFKTILSHLRSDRDFLDFHTGKHNNLPAFYQEINQKKLGKYYELMPLEECQPLHVPLSDLEVLNIS